MAANSRYPPVKIAESDSIRVPGGRRYMVCEGVYIPVHDIELGFIPDWRRNVHAIRDMAHRQDDVLICAFPKAGTHWLWEITTMLVKGQTDYSRSPKVTSMLEYNTPEVMDRLASPRIFNSHLPYRLLPVDGRQMGVKTIFIQRNPKDIIVSYFNMINNTRQPFSGTFHDWIHNSLFQPVYPMNWFDYTLEWDREIKTGQTGDLLGVYYERFKQNPTEEITRLSRFLGTSTDPDFISDVASKCSFINMRKANSDVKDLSKFQGDKRVFDNMYRKGEVGDWKNWFTVADNDLFDNVYKEKMADCNFSYTFSL